MSSTSPARRISVKLGGWMERTIPKPPGPQEPSVDVKHGDQGLNSNWRLRCS